MHFVQNLRILILKEVVKERADHESLANLERRANPEKSASLVKCVNRVVMHVGEFRVVLGCVVLYCVVLCWNTN